MSKVTILPKRTMDGFGRPAWRWSSGDNKKSVTGIFLGIWEVIPAKTTSNPDCWKESKEITNAGRTLEVVRSVNGKATSTTSPFLKVVIHGVFGVVPEGEGFFGGLQPGQIFLGKTDKGR